MANTELADDLQRISNRASQIQEIIKDVFESNGVDLPERQYIFVGGEEETAHDDEQLTISFAALRLGVTPTSTGMFNPACPPGYIATYFVELVRCTPQTGKNNSRLKTSIAPGQSELDSYGRSRAIDAWLLLRVGQNIKNLPETLGQVDFGIVAQKEQGTMQAIRLSVEVMV